MADASVFLRVFFIRRMPLKGSGNLNRLEQNGWYANTFDKQMKTVIPVILEAASVLVAPAPSSHLVYSAPGDERPYRRDATPIILGIAIIKNPDSRLRKATEYLNQDRFGAEGRLKKAG
ncbi:MAG: hypothetical protein WCD24_18715 [Serratia inhibens]|uniref:hypothetical protein n=1 Tax=Serratia inhibens TaxID=2338073 RepID=UPI003C7B8B6A